MDLRNEFENFVMFTLQSCENSVNKQCNLNSYIFLCWNNNDQHRYVLFMGTCATLCNWYAVLQLNFVAHFWFESVLQCSNFLHWCATMFEFSALLYVYRHANLCSGLRAILSPQFIKKFLHFLSIAPSGIRTHGS